MSDWWSFNKVMDCYEKPWLLDEEELQSLCTEHALSESYMREYKKYLYWGRLCQYQKMSIDFIEEMDKNGWIKWWNLAWNEKINIPEKLVEQHLDDMCRFNLTSWDIPIIDLFINRSFSKKFFMRNYCYIDWERVYKTISARSTMVLDKYKNWLIELGIQDKYGIKIQVKV